VPLVARPRTSVGKLERREGVDLEPKGERRAAGKAPLARRPYAPGEHGRRPPRRRSGYQEQLRAKQRAKRYYGLREGQFKRVFERASRGSGSTGDDLLRLLELRLDNVLVRPGLAATRAQAGSSSPTGTSLSTDGGSTFRALRSPRPDDRAPKRRAHRSSRAQRDRARLRDPCLVGGRP